MFKEKIALNNLINSKKSKIMKTLFSSLLLLLAFSNLSNAQKNNYKIVIEDNFLVIDESDTIKPNEIGIYLEKETKIDFDLKSFPRVLGKCKQEQFLENPKETINKIILNAQSSVSEDNSVYFEFNNYAGIIDSEVIFYTYDRHIHGSLPVRCSYEDGYYNLTIYSNDVAVFNQQILIKNNTIIKID